MSFKRLSKYSKDMLPQAGNFTDYTLCENISNYIPYDIGDASSVINKELDKINSLKSNHTSEIKTSINELDEEWGKKFVSVNDSGLNFVQPSEMENIFSEIDNDSNDEINKCKSLVENIKSGLTNVKEYVEKLQNNLEKYKMIVENLNNAKSRARDITSQINYIQGNDNPDYNTINSLNSDLSNANFDIQKLSIEVNLYESSKISEPDGQWIVQ